MRNDANSSYDIVQSKAYATLAAAASSQSATVDAKTYTSGCTFAIDVSSVGTGGILTVTVQNLETVGGSWTNEADDNTNRNDGNDIGNDETVVISAIGVTKVQVPNPRFQQFRLNFAATVDAINFSAIAIGHRVDSSV